MRGKKYEALKAKVPAAPVSITEAVQILQGQEKTKFDQTIELHVHLGVDHTKSDQSVRATVVLPSGSVKQKKIAVLASEAAEQDAAKAAGASLVGGEELIAAIEAKGSLDADVVVATPAMMPKIAKVARILGPKGLMPNPKTGTVTPNPAAVVKELNAGKITFKMDSLGNVHESVGKLSWTTEKIVANAEAVLETLKAARPANMRGQLIKTCTIKSTMSPAIPVGW